MKSEKLPLHMLGLMEGAGLHPGRGMPVDGSGRKPQTRHPGLRMPPASFLSLSLGRCVEYFGSRDHPCGTPVAPKQRMCAVPWDSHSVGSREALLASSRCLALSGARDTLGAPWVPWLGPGRSVE